MRKRDLEEIFNELGIPLKELTAEEHQRLMNDTFEYRARQNHTLGNFLLDHRLGQLLVGYGIFEHPVLVEKDKHQEKLTKMAQQFYDIGLAKDLDEGEVLARREGDFMPKGPEQVFLETQVDRVLQNRLMMGSHGDIDRDWPDYIDLDDEIDREITNISDLSQAKVYATMLPLVLPGKKSTWMQGRILELAQQRNWGRLLDFIYHNAQDARTIIDLEDNINTIKPALFADPEFRRYAMSHLIRMRMEKGLAPTTFLDDYLATLGLDISDPVERRANLDQEYVHRLIRRQWGKDQREYFEFINYLYQWDLLPDGFFEEGTTEFHRNLYEFVLLALHGNQYVYFKTRLDALSKAWKVAPEGGFGLSTQHYVYGRYLSLCSVSDHLPNPELRRIYG
jgi:hypothetical protein